MNNLFKILITVFLTLTTNVFAQSEQMIGVTAVVIGEVYNQNKEPLISGSKIYFGDTVNVKENSNTQILLLDETVLTVGENSELIIDEFIYDPATSIGKISTSILNGTVKVITGGISAQNPDNLKVKVPTGVIGARGTEFAVIAKNGKSTVVLLGPGPNNQLGLIPGNISLSDGLNTMDLIQPGMAGVITN